METLHERENIVRRASVDVANAPQRRRRGGMRRRDVAMIARASIRGIYPPWIGWKQQEDLICWYRRRIDPVVPINW